MTQEQPYGCEEDGISAPPVVNISPSLRELLVAGAWEDVKYWVLEKVIKGFVACIHILTISIFVALLCIGLVLLCCILVYLWRHCVLS